MIKYIFVSDMFVEDYVGGAELTSQALIDYNADEILKIRSTHINKEFILENRSKVWIIGNFAFLSKENIFLLIKLKIKYFLVEYDFKFCKYRSPEKHNFYEDCDGSHTTQGKLISLFFSKSKANFFMSEKQQKI